MINMFSTYIAPDAHEYLGRVLTSTMVSEGERVKSFESELTRELGIINPVAVNSGTSALHLALILAGVQAGDEVILPAQTFIATGLAILYQGAVPVFCDIQYETGNINPESIKSCITERTRAIMVVHWGGLPCDMDEIAEIASENNIPIIEDAAHALGATYKSSPIGAISDYTCFSFQAIKHLTTGDGGLVASKDLASYSEARALRWFGIDRANSPMSILGERIYDLDKIGFKYHMNDYSAALGLANLPSFKNRLDRLRNIDSIYRSRLSNVPGLKLFDRPMDRESACWLFGIHVDRRADFMAMMSDKNIATSVVHQRIDKNSIFKGRNILNNQELFDESQVHIPIHFDLTDDDIELIIQTIQSGW
jgi:perosamine synthetase